MKLTLSLRLALLFVALASPAQQQFDEWRAFADIWNPFAERMNSGVFDTKLWQKVRKEFHRLESVHP